MLKDTTAQKLEELIERYAVLKACQAEITAATDIICDGYRHGGKLIVCGNGGSAADAEHIVGELMKGFLLSRPINEDMRRRLREVCPEEAEYLIENLQGALPALSLVNQVALNTAFANDQAPDLSFAQQVMGMGASEDVLFAISTSGNSTNVLYAVQMARAKGIATIGLTGQSGGKLKNLTDVCICAPESATYRIQELHLPIYHAICIAVENEFLG